MRARTTATTQVPSQTGGWGRLRPQSGAAAFGAAHAVAKHRKPMREAPALPTKARPSYSKPHSQLWPLRQNRSPFTVVS